MCVQWSLAAAQLYQPGSAQFYLLRLHKDMGYTVFPMPGSGSYPFPALSNYYTMAIQCVLLVLSNMSHTPASFLSGMCHIQLKQWHKANT